jgi:hypothetical protein
MNYSVEDTAVDPRLIRSPDGSSTRWAWTKRSTPGTGGGGVEKFVNLECVLSAHSVLT